MKTLVKFVYKDQSWFEALDEQPIYRELSFAEDIGQDHRSISTHEIDSKTNSIRARHFTVVNLSRP